MQLIMLLAGHGFTSARVLRAAWDLSDTRTYTTIRRYASRGAIAVHRLPLSGQRLIMSTAAGAAEVQACTGSRPPTSITRIGRTLVAHSLAVQRAAIDAAHGVPLAECDYRAEAITHQGFLGRPYRSDAVIDLAGDSIASFAIEVELARKSPRRLREKIERIGASIAHGVETALIYCLAGQVRAGIERAIDAADIDADQREDIILMSPAWLCQPLV